MMSSSLRSLGSIVVVFFALACPGQIDPRPSGGESLGPTSEGEGSSVGVDSEDFPASTSGTSSPMSTSADPATSSPADDTTSGPPPATGTDTAPPPSLCDEVAGQSLIPPTTCDGPSGNTSTEIPPNGLYSTSWFGCYMQDDGSIYMDPFDNCEFACGNMGLCPAGQDGPTCEANLRWFAADADRYGCGGRIRVTNCDNGNAVVLVTLDRGPNCGTVEMPCEAPILDMSHDAMVHLFDGGTYGGCELQTVVVEPVDPSTPLGPV